MQELFIRNINKYGTLTTEEQLIVLTFFQYRTFRKRQYLLQEGDIARYETFILKGVTRTYETDKSGHEHIVQFGIEDWWVGDLYSFLSASPTRFNIDCIEDTCVMQISKNNLDHLYERVPKMERYFRNLLQNAFIASTTRVSSILVKSATERYRDFLEQYPDIKQRIPDHYIASYLGITPQSLSRIRTQLSIKINRILP